VEAAAAATSKAQQESHQEILIVESLQSDGRSGTSSLQQVATAKLNYGVSRIVAKEFVKSPTMRHSVHKIQNSVSTIPNRIFRLDIEAQFAPSCQA